MTIVHITSITCTMTNKIILINLLALFLASCTSQKNQQPNIIFLLADDHRWDALGCMGNPIIRTPNIDRIASEGIIFENAYVTTSICCASRASILAGQYASLTWIHDFNTAFSEKALAKTYPAILKKAGYFTGFIGKFGVGSQPPDTLFDYWEAMCGQPRYEHFDADSNMTHYTRIVSNNIMEFLGMCPDDQPFCLSVSFKAPHVQDGDPRQFIYDPAYKDLYKDDSIPPPLTAGNEYFEVFPEEFKQNNEARRRWELRFPDPEKYEESVRGYYRLITGVDAVVGEMLEKLDQYGVGENTIIIYSGDNGFYLGEHGMAGKWYGHEESIRVPLILFDPRPEQDRTGRRNGKIALNIDIAPTILSLCGEHIPQEMQGKNLMSLFDEEPGQWREDFLYEHLFNPPPEVVYIPRSEGVVSADYKYLKYIDFDPVFEELYDLRRDPYETDNLISDPEAKDMLDSLRNRYSELKKIYQ
jgi:arylsulfatase A-like enzyme